MNALQAKWDAIYSQAPTSPAACTLLASHKYLLPAAGKALDLACGLGGNALMLAAKGLSVEAWDVSGIALQKLQDQARNQQLSIHTRQVNIGPEMLQNATFDVIVISRFLDRALSNAIMAGLNTGGLLFYQTFTRNELDQAGPSNPDFLLASNELLRLFAPLMLVYYQEYAHIGDLLSGDRNEAYFIGQKPLAE